MISGYRKYLYLSYLVLVMSLDALVFDGFTLFSSYNNTQNTSLLISNNLNVLHTWEHNNGPASMPYLMPDSSIIYPYKVQNPFMIAPGV